MQQQFIDTILQACKADSLYEIEVIQSLWSDYGKIVRFGLKGGKHERVVVKHVRLPKQEKHPRGWNTDLSHQRKVRSYEVEMAFYQNYSSKSTSHCRMPNCIAFDTCGDEVLMVLEDLDASGFPERLSSVSMTEIEACVNWLANFHAVYLNQQPDDLWQVGSYWHLDTRPDELKVMDDKALRMAAKPIDIKLNDAKYKTLVHGDAKLANFCFSNEGSKVAAVDFQYVGGGIGMKDLAYFIGSCLYEDDCERYESVLLDHYFTVLKASINRLGKIVDFEALEKEWRELYPYAWTDFHRFLKGWSPDHWKINSYSERLARQVVSELQVK